MKYSFLFQQYLYLKFHVWMQWIDYRLGFQNLKKSYLENEIPDGVSRRLWKPDLVFVNALHRQNVQKEADLSYRIMIMMDKNGSSTEAPLDQFDEAKVYHSEKTQIWMQTVNILHFKCDFDLLYFPFDTQTCAAEVRITNNE